jgi:hypothetical protein
MKHKVSVVVLTAIFICLLAGKASADMITFMQFDGAQKEEIQNAFKLSKKKNGDQELERGLLGIFCNSTVCEVNLRVSDAKRGDKILSLEESYQDGTRWTGVRVLHQLGSSSNAVKIYNSMKSSTKIGRRFKLFQTGTAESSFVVSCRIQGPIGSQCEMTLKFKE